MAQPLSYSRIGEYHQLVNARILASLEGLTPTLANLISSLSDEQAKQWMETVNENVREAVEKANKGDVDAQRKRRQDKLIERAEFWIDTVNDKQERQLLEMASYQIAMRPVFYSIRDDLVAEVEAILVNRKDPNLPQRINDYFAHMIAFRNEENQSDMALYLARRYELLQRLDRNLSDKQRRSLRNKLASYSQDISALRQ